MKQEILSVSGGPDRGGFFIMDNKEKISGYYNNMKGAFIAMCLLCIHMPKQYTNIYDMPQKTYEREILGRD